jgi:hypothetical protein
MATKKAASKGAKKSGKAKKGTTKKGTTKKGTAKKSGATGKAAVKKSAAQAPVNPGRCTGWEAVQDSMPPRPPRLRVTGMCTFPTPGYKVTLKESVPQGINPRILLLTKTVTPPTGFQLQVLQTIPVHFEKKNATTKYTHVTIMPEGKTIKVEQVT